jgi:hypothetical protein
VARAHSNHRAAQHLGGARGGGGETGGWSEAAAHCEVLVVDEGRHHRLASGPLFVVAVSSSQSSTHDRAMWCRAVSTCSAMRR